MSRPQKYSTNELKQIIDLYIKRNSHKITKLSASKLAEYATNVLKKPAHYQDFTRKKEIKNYIDAFNNELTNRLIRTNNPTEIPIYQRLNIKKFLDKNDTREKLEKALSLLEKMREDVHDSYAELSKLLIKQIEETHKKEAEIKHLAQSNKELEISNNEHTKKQKSKIKELKYKNKMLNDKNQILEHFLKRYHYETIVEYMLYIEGVITSGVQIKNEDLIRLEDYKSGHYELSEVIKEYNNMTESLNCSNASGINNEVTSSIEEFFEKDLFTKELETENTFFNMSVVDGSSSIEKTTDGYAVKNNQETRLEKIENQIFKDFFD